MRLRNSEGSEAVVLVERETDKALLLSRDASSAWFPKSAIDADGNVAPWLPLTEKHRSLWIAPARRTTRFERRMRDHLMVYQGLRGRVL